MDIYLFFVGLFTGSFLNVLADRLPTGRTVIWGRSSCDYCKKHLRWFELIPLISFMVQGGRCARCKKKLSIQYPLMELTTGILYFFIFRYFGMTWQIFIPLLIIFSSYLVMTVADSNYQIIPDSMVITSAIGSVMLHMYDLPLSGWSMYIFSSLIAGLFFYALWYGTRGRGMGFGDVKLAFSIGLFLGYPLTIVAFYIAFLTGALLGVILILKGSKTLKSKIAFGPFMLLGSTVAFTWSPVFLRIWKTIF